MSRDAITPDLGGEGEGEGHAASVDLVLTQSHNRRPLPSFTLPRCPIANIAESVIVAAPPDKVWDAVVDFEARPHWEPRVKEAQIIGGGPLQEGSRIRLKVDRDRFTSTVVELRPEERLSLLVKGPGFRVNHIYELNAREDGTEVTMTGEYQGIIGKLAVRFMRGSVRRDLVDELAAIKRAAEAELSS